MSRAQMKQGIEMVAIKISIVHVFVSFNHTIWRYHEGAAIQELTAHSTMILSFSTIVYDKTRHPDTIDLFS